MKHVMIAFYLIVVMLSATRAQSTWKASDYKPVPYRKVMVLAKISDIAARKQLEDFTVKFLNDKGIVAIPAYSIFKMTNVASREAFLVIADSLQVDALLVYSVNGALTFTKSTKILAHSVTKKELR